MTAPERDPLAVEMRCLTAERLQLLRHRIERAADALSHAPFPLQHLDRTESIQVVNAGRELLTEVERLRGAEAEAERRKEASAYWNRRAEEEYRLALAAESRAARAEDERDEWRLAHRYMINRFFPSGSQEQTGASLQRRPGEDGATPDEGASLRVRAERAEVLLRETRAFVYSDVYKYNDKAEVDLLARIDAHLSETPKEPPK